MECDIQSVTIINRALGELQINALHVQCGAGGGEKRRGFLEVVMPQLDFKGQAVHLNPHSHSHEFYEVPGKEIG